LLHAANRKITGLEIWVDNSDGSIEKSSKSETDSSRTADVMENIETLEGVLVKVAEI
jgi:hypothetical protein